MARLTKPQEDMFHKYPVLRIPTERQSEQLIIGLTKAKAIMMFVDDIRKFVNKHSESVKDAA